MKRTDAECSRHISRSWAFHRARWRSGLFLYRSWAGLLGVAEPGLRLPSRADRNRRRDLRYCSAWSKAGAQHAGFVTEEDFRDDTVRARREDALVCFLRVDCRSAMV